MRQVGVLAAAGLVALEESPPLLCDDHANARFLAEGLARIPGIHIDPQKVQTNIVVFDVSATGKTTAAISAAPEASAACSSTPSTSARCARSPITMSAAPPAFRRWKRSARW